MSFVATGVVLAIALAIVKPWGEGPVATETSGRPRVAATGAEAAAPSARPTDDGGAELAAPVCLGASGWRIASLETWRDQDVRVWRAIEPIDDAQGPLDPAIPGVPVIALGVGGLGWCAPAYGPARPVGPARIEAWFITAGIAQKIGLRQIQPDHGTTPLAGLYVPLAPCALTEACAPNQTRPVTQAWPAGRVVFLYEDRETGATEWFAANVELLRADTRGGSNVQASSAAE
jgi:hypothetical protein